MEFAELIKISRIDNVRLRRPGKPGMDVTVAVTGHHLILSNIEDSPEAVDREIWLLHRGIHAVSKDNDAARSGTISLKYKNLRIFYLDIIGPESFLALYSTLTSLSRVDEATSAYPFFYNPGFKALVDGWCLFRPEEEYAKILLRCECTWRVSRANQEFSVCPTYGKLTIVPATMTDSQMLACAKHRIGGRFPVPVYIHSIDNNYIPLSRGSYTVAGWRNGEDEKLMAGIRSSHRKGFIICIHHDKGKNTVNKQEYDSVYTQWKRVNMKLPSVADLRESLASLAVACNDPTSEKWISRLSSARWLSYVKDVLNAACLVSQLVEREQSPVTVLEHHSVDMSLVLVCLAQIILNPDSRTLHGFEALIEREWIQGGHPFWSRHSGSTAEKETGPVFLIFLDAVFQIYTQFPCSFEFTEKILVLLADHSYASAFGTFLSDNEKERQLHAVREHTVSLWSYLNQVEILSAHINSLYTPNNSVIWPSVAPMSITLWNSFFLRWVQDQNNKNYERRKITEIIERNKNAKVEALKLRKELRELQEEALQLGLISGADSCTDTDLLPNPELQSETN